MGKYRYTAINGVSSPPSRADYRVVPITELQPPPLRYRYFRDVDFRAFQQSFPRHLARLCPPPSSCGLRDFRGVFQVRGFFEFFKKRVGTHAIFRWVSFTERPCGTKTVFACHSFYCTPNVTPRDVVCVGGADRLTAPTIPRGANALVWAPRRLRSLRQGLASGRPPSCVQPKDPVGA